MKIAYILTNERPLSGLIQTQVISLLGEIRRQRPDFEITLICVWQPWVWIKYADRISEMGALLKSNGLALENRPYCLLPFRHFMDTGALLPILASFLRFSFHFLGLGRFDIVHTRSYFGSLGAVSAKVSRRFKFVFDMRSLLPEENVTIGKWALGSPVFRRWKGYERQIAESADAIIAVSAPMQSEAAKIVPGKHVDLIPLTVDVDRFKFDPAERKRLRREWGWDDFQILAYQGSLGLEKQWNNVYNYASYFAALKVVAPQLRLVLVVEECRDEFFEAFSQHGVALDHVKFLQGTERLVPTLSAADVGMHVMSPGPDSGTRFGVKVVEYLSCGLPVITNSNVGAAANFLEANEAGLRLDLVPGYEVAVTRFLGSLPSKQKCRALAEKCFSVRANAASYISTYERIAG